MASDSEHRPEEADADKPAMGGNESTSTAGARAGAALSLEDFILLNEEIAGMARAGLPLDQGLAALATEMGSGRLRSVTATIAVDLKSGLTLPQAIERQAGRVPAFYARLLTAAVRSGKIGDVISTMTVYARTVADMRNTVVSALYYPLAVLVLSLLVFGGLSVFLVPHFEAIFADFGIKKPLLTQFAFWMFHNALWFFVGVPAAVIGNLLLVRFFVSRTPSGRQSWTRFWYAVPVVGGLLRAARLAAFADLLGILVDNGVPLPEAFLLAGQSSSDPLMVAGAEQVHSGLNMGLPLGRVLRGHPLVPEVVAWMVSLGEKRGTLGPTLHQIGEMYRRQVEMRAGLLRSVLPPLLVVVIAGFLVVTFVVVIILPIVSLIGTLGGGLK